MQDDRQTERVVKKFAEILAVRNKAYDTFVKQSKQAASEAHSEKLELKKELLAKKNRITDLVVSSDLWAT